MSARIDGMDAYLNQVAEIMNTSDRPVAEISKLKFFCSGHLEWCAGQAMQIMGGAGYLRGNAVERIYRDVKVMAIGGGSEEIMKDLAMKQMGLYAAMSEVTAQQPLAGLEVWNSPQW